MFLEQKNKNNAWQPSASIKNLKLRGLLLEKTRTFFKERQVLEVETPLMCSTAVTDPQLHAIPVTYSTAGGKINKPFYLQTSPEFAMKRLLAAGIGPIYQIGKAFRNEEEGRWHNPEFTILEWYRPGFDHHDLMNEMDVLLTTLLETLPSERITYEDLFLQKLNFNPHTVSLKELQDLSVEVSINMEVNLAKTLTIDDWLDVFMTHTIEPTLGFNAPIMVYDYPASKAALAKIRPVNPPVAERFEVYVNGIELANGYHELTDPMLQLDRFQQDNILRKELNKMQVPIDRYLLEALKFGLPSSAGVALGFDRLVMLKTKASSIKEVMAFTIDQV